VLISFDMEFAQDWMSIINSVVVSATLIALIVYTCYTKKLADLTAENALRPVILRKGFITWESNPGMVKENNRADAPLELGVYNHIATDISGYIIHNRRKYQLLFGNEISSQGMNGYGFVPVWGWLEQGAVIYAVYISENGVEYDGEDGFVVSYKDIEGRRYQTMESSRYSQKSIKAR
jgi:hypothetical protein